MEKRSPVAVLLLPFITFGIYALVWQVKTKGELVARGADIPTAWLLIVPIANIWWLWKYAVGSAAVARQFGAGGTFALLFLLGSIGQAIVQSGYNKVGQPAASAGPVAG